MTLHWRQGVTSAIVGLIAAALVTLILNGAIDGKQAQTARLIGVTIGASRLVEFGRTR